MTHLEQQSAKREFKLTGRHVLIGFCAFFGFILLTNVVMIYLAVSTFPGLESKSAYKAGRNYNQQIEAAREQDRLGWTGAIDIAAAEGGLTQIQVTYTDRRGQPLYDLSVDGVLRRTVHQKQDVPLQFKMIAPGVYSAAIDRDQFSGQWLLKVTAQDALDHTHRLDKKIYIRR